MSLFSIIRLELEKLLHKKTTLLSALNFVVPLLFGIGMISGFSFFVGEGVDAVSQELSAMDFIVNMLGQSKYLLFFIAIILAAISVASEIENGQMKSEVIRVCSRSKILLAKYFALLIFLGAVVLMFIIWCLATYAVMLLVNSPYASSEFFGQAIREQIYYIIFMFVGVAVAVSSTMLLGLKLKTFPCFAISYIGWFISLYSDFFGGLKLFIPYNLPDYALEQAGNAVILLPYVGLFLGYCGILTALAVVLFQCMDIKA